MKTSESIADLITALVKARPTFKPIAKTKTAKVRTKSGDSYSYTYADMSDVIDATVDALAKNGLVVQQPAVWDAEMNALVVLTRLSHVSGQFMEGRYPVRTYDRPQEQGGEITYARRYSLTAMLGISAEEDDDAQGAQHHGTTVAPPVAPKPAPAAPKPSAAPPAQTDAPANPPVKKGSITEAQQKRLFAIAKGAGWAKEDLRTALKHVFGVEHSNEINWSAYDRICEYFAKSPDQIAAEAADAELQAQAEAEAEARAAAEREDLPF